MIYKFVCVFLTKLAYSHYIINKYKAYNLRKILEKSLNSIKPFCLRKTQID